MSGIARLLVEKGQYVSGSDAKESLNVQDLRRRGIEVAIGHQPENVHGAVQVVTSTAIRKDNPEVLEAIRLGIPVIHRSQKLAELVNSHRGITIAGTHGKTTTSSLTATMLLSAGFAPSYVVGGIINTSSDNAQAGVGELFVIEADESDGSLVNYHPEIAVLTNIELDHMDYYRDVDHLNQVFSTYVQNLRPGGLCVYCTDDPGVTKLMKEQKVECLPYGLNDSAELTARHLVPDGMGTRFEVVYQGESLGEVKIHIPGRHNVQNSLAVVAVGMRVGLTFEQIATGLGAFRGVQRRFQVIGRNENLMVVDDYAHHPSEIKATLSAARAGTYGDRIIGIFQPHRYSRTQSFAKEFGGAFSQADEVVVTDIYGAGEDPIPQVTSDLIVQSLRDNQHPSVHYVSGLERVEDYVASIIKPRDLVITLGAGDVWKVAESLSRRLIA